MLTQERQRRSNQQLRQQAPYVVNNPDIAQVLEGEVGTFKLNVNGQSFVAVCQEGHSIKSLVPNGPETVWIVTPIEPQQAEQANVEGEYRGGENRR